MPHTLEETKAWKYKGRLIISENDDVYSIYARAYTAPGQSEEWHKFDEAFSLIEAQKLIDRTSLASASDIDVRDQRRYPRGTGYLYEHGIPKNRYSQPNRYPFARRVGALGGR